MFLVACAPAAGVVDRTLDPDNMINNYEFFQNAYQNVEAKTHQIRAYHEEYSASTSDNQREMIRMEVAAVQQSCRDLVADYNANASKSNRNIFMSSNLPTNIAYEVCE